MSLIPTTCEKQTHLRHFVNQFPKVKTLPNSRYGALVDDVPYDVLFLCGCGSYVGYTANSSEQRESDIMGHRHNREPLSLEPKLRVSYEPV